jgi:hypothetical protein
MPILRSSSSARGVTSLNVLARPFAGASRPSVGSRLSSSPLPRELALAA